MAALAALNARRRLARMRRGVVGAADLLQRQASTQGRFWAAFVTLTYAPGVEWRARHLSEFSDVVEKWLKRRRLPFCRVWVMELTRAGVPHYHMMVWLPHGTKLPKPDQAGWWPHGMSRIEKARSPVGYLVKYASKGTESDQLPKGARIFGRGGLQPHARLLLAWQMLPKYVRSRVDPGDRTIRAIGGGWVSRDTGEWFASPRLVLRDGALSWVAAPDS